MRLDQSVRLLSAAAALDRPAATASVCTPPLPLPLLFVSSSSAVLATMFICVVPLVAVHIDGVRSWVDVSRRSLAWLVGAQSNLQWAVRDKDNDHLREHKTTYVTSLVYSFYARLILFKSFLPLRHRFLHDCVVGSNKLTCTAQTALVCPPSCAAEQWPPHSLWMYEPINAHASRHASCPIWR